jgi:chorismate mutase
MPIRGIRGATTVGADVKEQVFTVTQELLTSILAANPGLRTEDIASALFTVSDDIVSTYPALAARQIGWSLVPMLCAREIPVPEGLPLCIRVLIHWNTDREQRAVKHVYLREAVKLRPDLVGSTQGNT